MSRTGAPTLAARASAPFAFADPQVNAVNDWLVRKAPWAYWPAKPPSAKHPVGADVHAAYLAQLVGVSIPIEIALRRRGADSSRIWRERAISVAATVIAAAVSSGAWDRRAARRRLFSR